MPGVNYPESGHALIVVLVFLMLSAVLLTSAIQMLKQDNQNTRYFEKSITDLSPN